jgi:hypothetical protein
MSGTLHVVGSLGLAAVCAVIGIGNLIRAVRYRQAADLAFAAILLFGGVLSTGTIGLIPLLGSVASDPHRLRLAALASAGASFGAIGADVFVYRVFHPSSRLALTKLLLVTVALSGIVLLEVTAQGATARNATLSGLLVRGCVYGWVGAVCFVQYTRGRARLRLGLSDGLVVNRFLVLAGAAFSVVATSTLMVVERGMGGDHSLIVVATSLARVSTALCLWIGCLPPRFYATWLERRLGSRAAAAAQPG